MFLKCFLKVMKMFCFLTVYFLLDSKKNLFLLSLTNFSPQKKTDYGKKILRQF
jgi:hypothetical protein